VHDSSVKYLTDASAVTPNQLQGFFDGWANPPSPEVHLAILRGSRHTIIAMKDTTVVGFIYAISDGFLSAYIPLLEVRQEYRGRGIGTELVVRMLDRLADLYMVDLTCDPELQPFYERIGLRPATGANVRNYALQAGRPQ
jgi:GNAT superfamily N-acetyltransferase